MVNKDALKKHAELWYGIPADKIIRIWQEVDGTIKMMFEAKMDPKAWRFVYGSAKED